MQRLDVEVASDFLVMASTLMQLKSKALLTMDQEAQEEVKGEKEKLAQRIEEYEQVKEIVGVLEKKQDEAEKIFRTRVRKAGVKKKRDPKTIPGQLFEVFKNAYNELKMREKIYKVSGEQYSLSKRIKKLRVLLKENKRISVKSLFEEANDKLDLIVTFLGILELIKLEFASFDKEVEGIYIYLKESV